MKHLKWTLLGLCCWGAAMAEPVLIVSGDDYAPYADSKLPQGGLAAALVKEAFAKVNRDVALAWLPWARGLGQTKKGIYAATFPYIKNEEREKDFLYSDEIISVRSTAFLKAGNKKFDFSRPETLSGSVYCLPLGWAPTPKLAALLNSGAIRRESPPTISSCAKMVMLGRADYFVYGDAQAAQALRDGDVPPGALVKADGPPLTTTPLYLLASKDVPGSAELLEAFNKGLASSQKDGTYAKIVKSYVP
jgi:polar amino acid transport system substrate-binding protein